MVSKLKLGIDAQRARRAVLRMGAGGVLAVGLAACGGGGGDDSDDIDLRAAYDKIVDGMTRADAIRIVGRNPNSESSDRTMYWSDGKGQQLDVDVQQDNDSITWVRWDKLTTPTATLRKTFV